MCVENVGSNVLGKKAWGLSEAFGLNGETKFTHNIIIFFMHALCLFPFWVFTTDGRESCQFDLHMTE